MGFIRTALLPGSDIWVGVCSQCGSIVLDYDAHRSWHAALTTDPSEGESRGE